MDSALEQYRLDKSDLNFGRAQGAAKLALELSFITADQFICLHGIFDLGTK